MTPQQEHPLEEDSASRFPGLLSCDSRASANEALEFPPVLECTRNTDAECGHSNGLWMDDPSERMRW